MFENKYRNTVLAGGAAAGFYTGGLPGIWKGVKDSAAIYDKSSQLYNKFFTKDMASRSRSVRRRNRSVARKPSTVKSGHSGHRSASRGRSSHGRSAVSFGESAGSTVQTSSTTRHATVKKRITRHKATKKKVVKVSKKLRKQIKAVTDYRKMPKGTYTALYASMKSTSGTKDVQSVFDGNASLPYLFTPNEVLQAASNLWNKMTVTAVPAPYTAPVTNGFDFKNLQVQVLDSYCEVRLANRTQRTLIVRMYIAYPKNNFTDNESRVFSTQWTAHMTTDATNLINVRGNGITEMFLDPRVSPTVKANWKIDCVTFTMDPGQTAEHTIQGPKNLMYDFSKMWNNISGAVVFENIRKNLTPSLCFVVIHDLLGAGGSGCGRLAGAADSGYGLCTEYRNFYKLAMPEQAGFKYPDAAIGINTSQPLNYRHPAYSFANWSTSDGSTVRIDEEQPSTVPTTILG